MTQQQHALRPCGPHFTIAALAVAMAAAAAGYPEHPVTVVALSAGRRGRSVWPRHRPRVGAGPETGRAGREPAGAGGNIGMAYVARAKGRRLHAGPWHHRHAKHQSLPVRQHDLRSGARLRADRAGVDHAQRHRQRQRQVAAPHGRHHPGRAPESGAQADSTLAGRRFVGAPDRRLFRGHGRHLDAACAVCGTSAFLPAVAGSQVDLLFDNLPGALAQIQDGGLVRGVAVTSAARDPSAPALPTVAESGLPGFDVIAWFALYAPRGTPEPVVRQLIEAAREAALAWIWPRASPRRAPSPARCSARNWPRSSRTSGANGAGWSRTRASPRNEKRHRFGHWRQPGHRPRHRRAADRNGYGQAVNFSQGAPESLLPGETFRSVDLADARAAAGEAARTGRVAPVLHLVNNAGMIEVAGIEGRHAGRAGAHHGRQPRGARRAAAGAAAGHARGPPRTSGQHRQPRARWANLGARPMARPRARWRP